MRILLSSVAILLLLNSCSLNNKSTGVNKALNDYYFPDQTEYRKGKKDAKAEIAAGNLAIESYGLPAPWSNHYEKELREKYGIEDRMVGFCTIDSETRGHASGFNEVMYAEIEKRYGSGILKEVAETARKTYEEKNRANTSEDQ